MGARQLVFWGASTEWFRQAKTDHGDPTLILDSHISTNNFFGVPVAKPQEASLSPRSHFVVITTSDFEAVASQLEEQGFEENRDFTVCNALKSSRNLLRLQRLSENFIVSSPDSLLSPATGPKRASRRGGGLFSGSIDQGELSKFEKVLDGKFRGFIRWKEGWVIVADGPARLVVCDEEFAVIREIHMNGSRLCGIVAIDDDTCAVVSADGPIWEVSIKTARNRIIANVSDPVMGGLVHPNDCAWDGEELWLTFFASKGLDWRRSRDSGGITSLAVGNGGLRIRETGSFMPHSPVIGDSVIWADSGAGKLRTLGGGAFASLPAFLRGLSHRDGFVLAGFSEQMYSLRGHATPSIVSSGLGIYSPEASAWYLLDLQGIRNIHSVY